MPVKTKSSRSSKKKTSRKTTPPPVTHDVAIECGEDKQHAGVGYYIIWTNSDVKKGCAVAFDTPDGCPLAPYDCKFTIPAASDSTHPGTYPTKVVGPGGKKEYHYDCSVCKGKAGQPIIIIY